MIEQLIIGDRIAASKLSYSVYFRVHIVPLHILINELLSELQCLWDVVVKRGTGYWYTLHSYLQSACAAWRAGYKVIVTELQCIR